MNIDYNYMRFSVSPKTADTLSLRQAIQSALVQTFGIAGGSIYLDILWVVEDGNEMVLRTNERVGRIFSNIVLALMLASKGFNDDCCRCHLSPDAQNITAKGIVVPACAL